MQSKLRLLGMTMGVILMTLFATVTHAQYKENVGNATVTTDKPDYAPRSNAVFTGKGFMPGDSVRLKVKNLTRACNTIDHTDSSYQVWTVLADASGSFVTNWTVCDCNGDSLRLRAVGLSSHDTAYAYFSDAAAIDGEGTMSVASILTPICSGSSGNGFTFTFTKPNGRDFLSGSQLKLTIPTGWTAPQNSLNTSPGYITVTTIGGGTATISSILGNVIIVDITLGNNQSFNITYEGGGTKVTVPIPGSYSFTTETKQNNGTLKSLSSGSPSITVVNSLPSSTTGTATNITSSSATIPGIITANGCTSISAYGVEYSTTNGFANGSGTQIFGSNLASNSFSVNLSGLSASTTYYYHSYATNDGGTAYSAQGSFTTSPPANSISTSTIAGSPFCASGAVSVPFTSVGTYSGNTYTAQLSDASGSFSSPTAIGTFASNSNSGTINATIPDNVNTGTGYRIRVVSSNPIVVGSNNGADLKINAAPTLSGASQAATICDNKPVTINLSGLQPNNTSKVYYSYNGTVQIPINVISDGTGTGSFSTSFGVTNGKTIVITRIDIINGTVTCSKAFNQTVTITANPVPTISVASNATAVCFSVNSQSSNLTYNNATNATTYSILWSTAALNAGFTNVTDAALTPGSFPIAVPANAAPTTYSGSVSVKSSNGCKSSEFAFDIVVKPLPNTTASSNSPVTYGGTLNLSATSVAGAIYSWSGPNGFTSTSQNPSISNITMAAAGTYSVTATVNGCTSNPSTIVVSINKKTLTVTADNQTKVYGAANPTLTATITGFANGETLATSGVTGSASLTTSADETSGVGTYAISAAAGTLASSNYNFTFAPGTLAVGQKALQVTAKNTSKTYGETVTFAGTEFTTSGLVNSDAVNSVSLSSDGAVATAPASTTPYTIVAENATGSGLSNYSITYGNGTLAVGQKALQVTAKNTSKMYGETVTFAGTEFTTSGLVNSDAVNSVSLSSDGAVATAPASTTPYTIVAENATGSGLSNYSITYGNGTLAVGQKALQVTAKNTSKTYGETVTFAGTEFTTSGLVNSDAVNSVSLSSDGAVATAPASTTPYTIVAENATGSGLSNYSITYGNGTLAVGQKALQVTAKNTSKTYGETVTFAGTEFTTSGLVNSDAVNSVSLSSDGAVATAPASTTPYTIVAENATGSGLSNYSITYGNGTLAVGQKALQVTAKNTSKTYGETVTFAGTEFTTSGLVNSDAVNSVSLSSDGAVATAPASTTPYTIVAENATGSGLSNYSITYGNGTLAVGQKALQVTAKNTSKTYGETVTFAGTEFTTSGLVNSDAVNSVSLSSDGAVATAPASTTPYTIVAENATGSGLSNYSITYGNGTLAVGQKALQVTAKNTSKTYGETVTFAGTEFTTSGLVNSDAVNSVSLSSDGAVATAPASTTPYTIVAENATGSGLSNYSITYGNGTLAVGQKALQVTAKNTSKTYGETVTFAGTEFTTSGLVNSDAVNSVSLSSDGAVATAPASTTPYTIVAENATGSGLSNYSITYGNGILAVGQKALQVTAKNTSKTYGETVTFAGTEFTTSGLVNSDAVNSVSLSSDGAVATAPASTTPYTIVAENATGSGLSNYSITYGNGTLAVGQKALQVTAKNTSKTYGETVTFAGTEFTTSGLVNSDAVNSVSLSSDGAVATAPASTTPYTIVAENATGSGLSNYSITYGNGTLAVGQKALQVTAKNTSKTYGETVTFAGTEFTTSGLVNSDAVNSVSLSSDGAVATAPASTTPYTIVAENATGSGLSNYSITYGNGTLAVGQKALQVTAKNTSKTYGETVTFAGTEFTTSGLVNSDAVNSVSLSSDGAVATAPASTTPYTIVAENATGSGLSNYSITYGNGTLAVGQKALQVTAKNTSKTYGETVTFAGTEFTTSGLVNSDAVNSVSLSSDGAVATAPASTTPYTIVAENATGSGLSNYSITYGNGTLAVGQKALQVTAKNTSKTYGETVTFAGTEFTTSGLVNSDAVNSVSLSSDGAVATAPASTTPYTIVAENATGSGLSNYSITYGNGTLAVGQKALQVTAKNTSKTYGETVTFAGTEFTTSGLVNSDAVNSVSLSSDGAVATAPASTTPYTIVAENATGSGLSNYSITYGNGTLAVGQKALQVTAKNTSKTYGETVTFAGTEFTTSGLVNSDAVNSVSLSSDGAVATAPASTTPYTIVAENATGSGLSNYSITYGNGTLAVGQKALQVTAKNTSKTYGETVTFAGTEFTTSGLVNSDAVNSVSLSSDGAVATAPASTTPYTIVAENATGSGLSNYSITYGNGTLAVGQKALQVTAKNTSKTYGETVTFAGTEFTTSGLVNSDAVNSVSLSSDGAVATAPASTTPYTIVAENATGSGLSNYSITYGNGTLAVGQKALQVTAKNTSKTYGETVTFAGTEFTTSGLVNSDAVNSVSLSSDGAVATAPASTTPYTIVAENATGSGLSNYSITYGNGTLAVGQKALQVTAKNTSKTYGETVTFAGTEFTTSGLVNSDAVNSVSLSSDGAVATAPASTTPYTIVAENATGSGLSNYSITYGNGTLAVGQKALQVTAKNTSKTYGETVTFAGTEFTTSGLVNSDAVNSVSLSSDGAVATAPASTTPYTIVAENATGSGLSNYSITYGNGTLAVGQKALQVTAKNTSKTYGETVTFAGTEFTTSGLVNSDAVNSVSLSSDGAVATAPASTTPYTIVAENATGSGLSNYSITYGNGTLAVGQKALQVTAKNTSKTYGETVTFAGTEFTTSGLVNSDAVNSVSLSSDGAVATAPASTTPYTIVAENATGSGLSNYSITYGNGTLAVGQKALQVTAKNTSKTYGETVTFAGTEFTTSGLVNSDAVNSVSLSSDGAVATAPASTTPYTIVAENATGSGLSNYSITYGNGTLAVGQKALQVTAKNTSKTYGETVTFAGTEFTTSGLVNSDAVNSVSLSSDGAVATAPASTTPYTIVAENATGSGLSNYSITYGNGTLAVGQKALQVTAKNTSKTYGETVTFAGTEFTTSGLVNSDAVNSVSLSSDGAVATAPASTTPYTIVAENATGSGLSNYSITYGNGTLAVGQKALQVTAKNTSKTYGETVTFAGTEFTTSGLVNSDAVNSVSLSSDGAVATAPASTTPYTIVAENATGSGLSNYSITYGNGTLAVGQKALQVTAKNTSKTYGETVTFAGTEFTTSGLVNSDAVNSVSLSSDGAVATAPASTTPYTIVAENATGSGLSNYSITYGNGTLAVGQKALQVTAKNTSKTYGETVTFAGTEFTTSGLVNSDAVNSVSLSSDGAVATAPASTTPYTIVAENATGSGLSNYSITYGNGNLYINKALLTVTAASRNKYCGQINPPLVAEITGFVLGQALSTSGVTGNPLVTTSANENSGAGSYTINVTNGNLASGNYSFTFVQGTLTINGISSVVVSTMNPVALGSSATLIATITPAVAGVPINFKLDGIVKGTSSTNSSGVATLTVSGLTSDVYRVTAIAGAGCANSELTPVYLPIYDPSGGFITGGGWINSPIYPSLKYMKVAGKANFGFVSKYEKGKSVPTGNTEFQFKEGDMNFSSTSYDWLVVSGGKKGQYKGTGTINGTGTYGFILTAIDGDAANPKTADLFRIKIYDKLTNVVVYDNQYGTGTTLDDADPTTAIAGGSIVIHDNNSKTVTAAKIANLNVEVVAGFDLKAYPNPSPSQFTLKLQSNNREEKIQVRVMDLNGRVVELFNNLSANQTLQIGGNYRPGMYIVEMIQGNERKQLKLVKQPN